MELPFFKRNKPVIRERQEHCISRANIDPDAIKVLYRLANTGHTAYLVGGSVRDLLLGRQPKDFDIGTDARPNDIRRLFRNCFLIGRRFRLAHIVFGRKVIETSTFRRQPDESEQDGTYQTEDNTFGTPEEDAKRRDFTVNGLFYDIKTFAVIDYVGGLKDLEKRVLRCIGDPNVRFREDPVRMMRAVKFAARLGFSIDRASRKAILKHHAEIANASVPRLCEEVYRLFTYASSRAAFQLLWEHQLLSDLLPEVDAYVNRTGGARSPLWRYLEALDRHPQNADLPNGVRTACLYYPLFLEELRAEEAHGRGGRVNRQHVARVVLHPLAQRLHVPKATLYAAVAALDLQRRLDEHPRKGRSQRLVYHASFDEALVLREVVQAADGGDAGLLEAWQSLYREEAGRQQQQQPPRQPAEEELPEEANAPRDAEPLEDRPRRRRRRRRKPRGGEATAGAAAVTVTETSDDAERTDGCE